MHGQCWLSKLYLSSSRGFASSQMYCDHPAGRVNIDSFLLDALITSAPNKPGRCLPSASAAIIALHTAIFYIYRTVFGLTV